jgi:hypothetical protein
LHHSAIPFALLLIRGRNSYIVAGALFLAGARLFFRMKRDDADFMYLKEEGKKEALAATKKPM